MVFKRRGDAKRSRGTRLYFCTDIHGSEKCFRKFLKAGDFYQVDHLILGGDMTGKSIVPILKSSDGYSCTYLEREYRDLGSSGLAELRELIRGHGAYAIVGTADELALLDDSEQRESVFRKAIAHGVMQWVELAEERLQGTGRRIYVAPGNDDFLEIDESLKGSDTVVFAENTCIALDENHEMITTGYSNRTPWNTERELEEDEMRARLDALAAQASGAHNLIGVIHPPPFDSRLDMAPGLQREESGDLTLRVSAGTVVMTPVGSTGVRSFIEDQQPVLTLHGHVHESSGITSIGRTVCINPGSEYTEGILNGAIVEIGDGEVMTRQLVVG
jgi:Icc-related predicted phosphoesterase